MGKNKNSCISSTSQKEPFPCCICGKIIKSQETYMALGCHIGCAEMPTMIEQLLRNYLSLLKKEVESTPKDKVGDIEFCNDELKRIDQSQGI